MTSDSLVQELMFLDKNIFNHAKGKEVEITPGLSLGWDKRNGQRNLRISIGGAILGFNYRAMIELHCSRVWRDLVHCTKNRDIPFNVAMGIYFNANRNYLISSLKEVRKNDFRMCDKNHELIIEEARSLFTLDEDVGNFYTCGNCLFESNVYYVVEINAKANKELTTADEHDVFKNILFNADIRKDPREFLRLFNFILCPPAELYSKIQQSKYTLSEEII